MPGPRVCCAAFVVVGLLLGGCAGRRDAPEPDAATYGADVTAGPSTSLVDESVASTTAVVDPKAAPTSATVRKTATTSPTARPDAAPRTVCEGDPVGSPNSTDRTERGLLLRLTAADRLCFGARDGVTIELQVKNTGSSSVLYESTKYEMFSINREDGKPPGWKDSCGTPPQSPNPTPPIELEPGETVRFVADYPHQPGDSAASSPCHVLQAGVHLVQARFRMCPDGSTSRGYCDPQQVVEIAAEQIRIEIAAT